MKTKMLVIFAGLLLGIIACIGFPSPLFANGPLLYCDPSQNPSYCLPAENRVGGTPCVVPTGSNPGEACETLPDDNQTGIVYGCEPQDVGRGLCTLQIYPNVCDPICHPDLGTLDLPRLPLETRDNIGLARIPIVDPDYTPPRCQVSGAENCPADTQPGEALLTFGFETQGSNGEETRLVVDIRFAGGLANDNINFTQNMPPAMDVTLHYGAHSAPTVLLDAGGEDHLYTSDLLSDEFSKLTTSNTALTGATIQYLDENGNPLGDPFEVNFGANDNGPVDYEWRGDDMG